MPKSLSAIALCGFSLIGLAGEPAPAPSVDGEARIQEDRPQIVAIYGPRYSTVGQPENYRVRIKPGAGQPIIYRWSLGDGTLATGNNISHEYARPGRYVVNVTVRNARGHDTGSLKVAVSPERPSEALASDDGRATAGRTTSSFEDARAKEAESPRAATRAGGLWGAGGLDWSRGGYTLLVSTHFTRKKAEEASLRFRSEGFRSGIFVDDEGPGSTAYRVVVGQFETSDPAVSARRNLIKEGRKGAFLVHPLP
jgi:hypothetical protein